MRHIPLPPGADDNLMRGSNDSSTTNGANGSNVRGMEWPEGEDHYLCLRGSSRA